MGKVQIRVLHTYRFREACKGTLLWGERVALKEGEKFGHVLGTGEPPDEGKAKGASTLQVLP
jgi:hypothetical protein